MMSDHTFINKASGALYKSLFKISEKILFLLLVLFNLTPIIWGVLTSIKSKREIFAFPPKLLGFSLSLEHYETIFKSGYLKTILNSGLYCLASIVLGLFLALIAGYGFQRYSFRFKKSLFFLVVSGIPLSIGSSALLIPNYIYMAKLGLTNHWYTLVLLFTAYNLPMAIWIVKGGIEAIPVEIEEAATIDGCPRTYILFRIITSLSRPSMASAALFIFIGAWNEFIVAAVMINSPELRPVQLAIYNYLGFFGQEWGPLTAAASTAIIPKLLMFTILGRMLISGLTQGSVKG